MATAWKGTISFGLVNIPITLYPAFKSKELEFHLLHKEDHGRIGYQKVCKRCGKILRPEDIVKAYEHEKDEYVPLEKEELEQGKAPNTRNLEISLFVKDGEIDSRLYERPYYVMPGKNAENLYVLLREAIRSSGKTGIGKIQFGSREHLAALKVDGPAIVLNLMHYVDELEDPKALSFPPQDKEVGKKELELAKQLVSSMEGRFRPEEFHDEHRERLHETIREKISAAAPAAAAGRGKEKQRKVIDLMERLRESLKQSEKPGRSTRRAHAPSGSSPRKHKVG
jgi:DNA end-binding protein Ku